MKVVIFLIFSSLLASANVSHSADLEKIKRDNNLPGLISGFYQNGIMKEIAAVGERKIHERFKLTTKDKFHLGSCTKSMTATLAAILIEEGYLSWDTRLIDLNLDIDIHPDFKNVTFDMLLAHRSGVASFTKDEEIGDLWYIFDSGWYSPTQARAMVALTQLAKPSIISPGEYLYSNAGYMIAAYILEHLTGMTYQGLMKEKVFKPLNMNSCGFGKTSSLSTRTPLQPWGHYTNEDGKIISIHRDNPPAFTPAASVHCNFNDWAKYLSIHMNAMNEDYDLLDKTSFQKLHQLYPAKDSFYTYGGWIKIKRTWGNGYVYTHGGTNTYNISRVWIAPKRNAIMMSASNIMNHQAMEDAIVNLINRNLK